MNSNSTGSLAFGYVSGGFGCVTDRQVVNNSAGSLAFGYVPGGFGCVTDRQIVLA